MDKDDQHPAQETPGENDAQVERPSVLPVILQIPRKYAQIQRTDKKWTNVLKTGGMRWNDTPIFNTNNMDTVRQHYILRQLTDEGHETVQVSFSYRMLDEPIITH